jgi:hypothetical protein
MQQATPIYVLPYVGEPPTRMTKDERRAWSRKDPSKVVTADQVRELAAKTKKSNHIAALFEDLRLGLMD